MNLSKRILPAMTLMFAAVTFSNLSYATNGYFTHGVGTESKGMAGTGIGSNAANGSIIAASNPALGVFADDGWEAGLSFFSPRRSYAASASQANGQGGAFTIGEGKFDSSSNWFPIPYISKNWRLSSGNVITTSFYGRGGMNTDWDDPNASATLDPDGPGPAPVMTLPGPFGGGPAGVDLMQAFLSVYYSGKTSDRFTWGVGPVFAVQAFSADGVVMFSGYTKTFAEPLLSGGAPGNPTSLTNNGHDFSIGYGFGAGVWFAMNDAVSLGVSYQSKMSMGEFDDYSDLFAQDGGFDIPSSAKIGLSIEANANTRVNLDIEHTSFSEVDSVGNPMANIAGCVTAGMGGTGVESCLGGSTGAGFGWEDMTTYKVGVEWGNSDATTWRAGYSYGEQPIQGADIMFNILAPGVMEQHFTFGMTKKRENGGAWSLSLMYAPENSVRAPAMFDPTQTIELSMSQFEMEFSYLW